MTPADDLFSRAVIGSVVVFALLATVHFLLPARIGAALRRFHPVIGLASMSVAIACDVPVVASSCGSWHFGTSSCARSPKSWTRS